MSGRQDKKIDRQKPYKKKKSYTKQSLREEFLASGLSKPEFFKAKFSKGNLGTSARFSPRSSSRPVGIFKKGMIIRARVVDVLVDMGNSYLSALAEYEGKEIFLERIPEHVNVEHIVMVKLVARNNKIWVADFIRLLQTAVPLIGIYMAASKTIHSIHRKRDFQAVLCLDALPDQMVVVFEEKDGVAQIKEQIGLMSSPHSYSKVAAFNKGVWKPVHLEEEKFCEHFEVPSLKDREDMRDIHFVTIDGADARDFDDAVWAQPDSDPRNPGGYRIVVAIADVSYYVREGDLLDQKARDRGNSIYFPDYVLPMLPERLSNDLCSLRPHVDRACVVADMLITKNGKLKQAHFKRALMRSKARLTYEEVDEAFKGNINSTVAPVYASTLLPLLNAYKILRQARDERGSLDIHSVEHKIVFDEDHHVKEVTVRQELASHQLIEEMMVLTNIAVAKALKNRDYPCLYRIHPAPDAMKVQHLKIFTKALHLPTLKSDKPTPHEFNRILQVVKGGRYESLLNDLILRCQAQAQYSPHNQGHYGLGLFDYCHFTSPIRRYSDLIVHRLLITLFDLGEGGYRYESLDAIAEHISNTERQAVAAEREADERFLVAYLEQHKGDVFNAVVIGVNPSGFFVELAGVYAEAFVPKRLLFEFTDRSSFYFDQAFQILRVGHLSYQLGLSLKVRLIEVNAVTCQVIAQPVTEDDPKEKRSKKNSKKEERARTTTKKKREK